MKEKTDLINKDLSFENFSNIAIADCLEISYILGRCHDISKINNIIGDFAADGINTYAVFCKFCYEEFMKHHINSFYSIDDFLQYETEDCIEKFINKYFEIK